MQVGCNAASYFGFLADSPDCGNCQLWTLELGCALPEDAPTFPDPVVFLYKDLGDDCGCVGGCADYAPGEGAFEAPIDFGAYGFYGEFGEGRFDLTPEQLRRLGREDLIQT